MDNIIFECQSVTPMFMYGADGRTPELRPASIKGVMRFWWRAIHGHLSLIELKNQEDEIFGSTEKKSKIIIYPIETNQSEDYEISLTPHHKEGYCSNEDGNKGCYFRNGKCMKANKKRGKLYKFKIKMAIKHNEYMTKEELKNLFIITATLGGFGQRSRRGFGSIQITKIDNTIFNFPKTTKDIKDKINNSFKYTSTINYPYIQEIKKIGKKYTNFQNLLETIGKASHDFDCDELGYAKRQERLASPVYVSVLKFGDNDYRPIITILKNTKSNDVGNVENFIKAINE